MHRQLQSKILLGNFFLKKIYFFFEIYVPVGLFGLAIKTIFVFLFTKDKIFLTENLKFSSFAYFIFALFILL